MVLGRSGRSGRPVSRSFQKGGVRKISRAPCASEKSALRAGNEYCQGRSRASTLEREWLAPARSSSRGENAGALSALRGIGQRRIHGDQRRRCGVRSLPKTPEGQNIYRSKVDFVSCTISNRPVTPSTRSFPTGPWFLDNPARSRSNSLIRKGICAKSSAFPRHRPDFGEA